MGFPFDERVTLFTFIVPLVSRGVNSVECFQGFGLSIGSALNLRSEAEPV